MYGSELGLQRVAVRRFGWEREAHRGGVDRGIRYEVADYEVARQTDTAESTPQ